MRPSSHEPGTRRVEQFEDGFPLEFWVVDRRQVARAQTDQAIRTLIIDGDVVSATVLAWAAIDVLRGVAKDQGVTTWMDTMEEVTGNCRSLEIIKQLKAHYNYLKHAQRDPDIILTKLSPDVAMLLLYGASTDFENLYGKITLDMFLHRLWALCRVPGVDWPPHLETLGPKLNIFFGYPAAKPFSDARTGVSELLDLARLDRERFMEKMFGGVPDRIEL